MYITPVSITPDEFQSLIGSNCASRDKWKAVGSACTYNNGNNGDTTIDKCEIAILYSFK